MECGESTGARPPLVKLHVAHDHHAMLLHAEHAETPSLTWEPLLWVLGRKTSTTRVHIRQTHECYNIHKHSRLESTNHAAALDQSHHLGPHAIVMEHDEPRIPYEHC